MEAGAALLIAIASYLLGSIPFGLLLSRLAGAPDPRTVGSGNIGATNVLRSGGRKLAAATLILDAVKGSVAVLLAARWGEQYALLAGAAAFLGHCFPIWLGLRGGKGVATFIGVLAALAWPAALAFALIWAIVAGMTRYSSLAALTASALIPVFLFATGEKTMAALFALLALLVWYRHRENIARLLSRQESKMGAGQR